MKKTLYTLLLLLLPFLTPAIQAQDVAIVGLDGTGGSNGPGDEITFVLLRNFAAGEVIYFTEAEYSDSANNFQSEEGHLTYTVPAGGLLENEVVRIFEDGTDTFTVQCAGGTAVHVAGSGQWSFFNSDEMYAYSASNPASPWSSITEVHCFYSGSETPPKTDQEINNDWPNGICIAINRENGVGPMAANFNDESRGNTDLATLQNTANWTKSTEDISLSCTDFTNQMIATALPIELTSFEASLSGKVVLLDWITETEVNNEKFEVEHSTDGQIFTAIGTLAGEGTSNETNFYQMVHAAPEFGVNHYRLKQVDYDGTFAYSDIVSEEYRGSNDEATAYPNPFDQSVTVQFPSTDNVSSSPSLRAIKIYDVYGKLVHSERVSSNAPTVTLKLPNLSNGTYFLHATNGHETLSTLRIVKD